MWPIKWKEILYRITIQNWKMSQYNSLESALKMDLILFYFEDSSKSTRGIILFLLVTCSYIPMLLKSAEKPAVIWLFTQNCFKSTVSYIYYLLKLQIVCVPWSEGVEDCVWVTGYNLLFLWLHKKKRSKEKKEEKNHSHDS